MTPVRYFKSSQALEDFDHAHMGYFMQFGLINESTMAIVRDKHTGKCEVTFCDFIKFESNPQDILLDAVLDKVKLALPLKKHDEIEVEIRELFSTYGTI